MELQKQTRCIRVFPQKESLFDFGHRDDNLVRLSAYIHQRSLLFTQFLDTTLV